MKNKQKRRQKEALEAPDEAAPRQESYVDKNRAIGVSAGDDLKGSIMKHRGKLMDKNAIFSEFDINVLIEQAIHEMRYGDAQVFTFTFEKLSKFYHNYILESSFVLGERHLYSA